eukprot:199111-Chlamydomonas_euryale.AAC.2
MDGWMDVSVERARRVSPSPPFSQDPQPPFPPLAFPPSPLRPPTTSMSPCHCTISATYSLSPAMGCTSGGKHADTPRCTSSLGVPSTPTSAPTMELRLGSSAGRWRASVPRKTTTPRRTRS